TNSGNSTLNVTGLELPGGFSGDWNGGAISAGASQDVTVTFSPIAPIGYSGNVTVSSDATSGGNTIAISGAGAPTRILGLSGNLAFGTVQVGATATATLTIANSGNSALDITSLGYPIGFSGNFAGAIAPGASQDVTVTF